MFRIHRIVCVLASCLAGTLVLTEIDPNASAAIVTVKSGSQYEGAVVRISSVGDSPATPNSNVERRPIVVIDDDVRYTFVPFWQTPQNGGFAETPPKNLERIRIDQIVATSGRQIKVIGDVLSISPFDEFGRRTYVMREGAAGTLPVFQGITEITPNYTKIEGMGGVANPIVWELRVATSSIPSATLRKVLLHAEGADPKNIDARLRVLRLFIQAEMYREALTELMEMGKEFPEMAAQLKEQQTRLVQFLAQQVLSEIQLRRSAGQHDRAQALLNNFPDQDVAGETLLRVRDLLKEYDGQRKQYERIVASLTQHLDELKDATLKKKLQPICDEIRNPQLGLNYHNLDRMADYLRFIDDNTMSADRKISLAVSGWLLGNGAGIENLSVALSLVETRELVFQYLRADLLHEREELLGKIKMLEGGTPELVTKILANMRPPVETQAMDMGVPGLFEITIPGIQEQPEFSYLVQLPPEYNPSRRYPCIVSLNGGGSTELQQISWWAGDFQEKSAMRSGQASRRGYIVIAPKWQRPLQVEYEYSMREHAAVLYSLRDACRRMAIDTDHVFLSGHFTGGDAAWDISLAHPDLWAGCVMVAPRADRYVKFYSENARHIPLYFIGGEKDGGTPAEGNWLGENAVELDRYLSDTLTDCTLVLYHGRGKDRDGFSDEIQRIFQWMEVPNRRREFSPQKFEMSALRPWDNFFWWVEAEGYPATSIVYPLAWPQPGARVAKTEAEIVAKTGRINVHPTSESVTIWLSPDLVDFTKPVVVAVNGKEVRDDIKPSVDVILDDVRRRGDRQHPFWAKVEWPGRPDRGKKR